MTLTVPLDQSILETVQKVRPDVACYCSEGYCGTCETGVLEGQPEHGGHSCPPRNTTKRGRRSSAWDAPGARSWSSNSECAGPRPRGTGPKKRTDLHTPLPCSAAVGASAVPAAVATVQRGR
ncbi:2Fe-2S iron-sulfur cluster-binding protein [Nocardiopsis kunsanensis]|uniref:2Fe-2S iron-sulfur cluster-binding protein n=1 Tax=Nocardiopsis kunsanensis TaxID=141693 RepID=UPI00373AE5CF